MPLPPWSATRARTFQECRRKYHYRYHLAPLARKPGAPPEALQADRVKDLVGLEAWAGELVHTVIRAALDRWRAGREWSEAEAVAHATRLLSRQFRASQEYWDADPDEFPRRPALLDVHFYREGTAVTRERAAQIRQRVHDCVRGFLRSELAHRIRAAGPRQWLPIDRNAAARLAPDL